MGAQKSKPSGNSISKGGRHQKTHIGQVSPIELVHAGKPGWEAVSFEGEQLSQLHTGLSNSTAALPVKTIESVRTPSTKSQLKEASPRSAGKSFGSDTRADSRHSPERFSPRRGSLDAKARVVNERPSSPSGHKTSNLDTRIDARQQPARKADSAVARPPPSRITAPPAPSDPRPPFAGRTGVPASPARATSAGDARSALAAARCSEDPKANVAPETHVARVRAGTAQARKPNLNGPNKLEAPAWAAPVQPLVEPAKAGRRHSLDPQPIPPRRSSENSSRSEQSTKGHRHSRRASCAISVDSTHCEEWRRTSRSPGHSPTRTTTTTPTNASSSICRSRGSSPVPGIAAKIRQISIESASTVEPVLPHQRRIRWCDKFEDMYRLGEKVMPSAHKKMEVRFAVAKAAAWPVAEGTDVVIKVRQKSGGFSSKRAETAWRASSERFLGLPASNSLVQMYDILEDENAYYVVMERVGGKDLGMVLFCEGRLPVEDAKEVLRQLLQGVAELHANGCIHKDIKLENVMLDRLAVLSRRPSGNDSPCSSITPLCFPREPGLDSSLAKRRSSSSGPGAGRAGELPETPSELPNGAVRLIDFDTLMEWTPLSPKANDVLGTDQYIAPEAYDGKYSPASDMFAVGVCAYALLTGVFPFSHSIFDDKPGENWVGSPKMSEVKGRLSKEQIDWRHHVFRDTGALSLVSRMLAMDERARPTAREALGDPWLRASRSAARAYNNLSPLWTPLAQLP